MLIKKPFFFALATLVALYAAACGGGSHSSAGGTQSSPAITITAATLPTGYVGSDYASTTLKATGGSGTGYSWSVSGAGALPAGITLSSAGMIAGKPTAAGTANFSVKVTDSAGASATAQLSVVVKPGVSITTAVTLPDAYAGSPYSQALAASGGSGSGYTWALASGSTLPYGLVLSPTGLLNGKPTASGALDFSVIVTDSAQNTATAQFSASVKTGLSVSTPALPPAYLGTAYAQQLIASGGSGTGYAWSLPNAAPALRPKVRRMVTNGLPTGLSLSPDGWITGTPTASGDFTATVIVTDSASNTASTNISISIASAIAITTPSVLPGGNQGDLYSQTFAAAGGTGSGYLWTVAGDTTLPGGLRLSSDGILSGSLPAANSYTFGITVTDSAQNSATATFTLKVVNPLRFTTTPTLPETFPGVTYQLTLLAKGGSGHGYTYTLSAGSSLPAGLTLTSAGVLSGKPTAAGTFQFNITVTDSAANKAAANFSLTVGAGVTITTGSTLPVATVGSPYMQTLAVTGGSGSGYIWTLTQGAASLSAVGLHFSNGAVSGTPTTIGTASFSVSVVDSSLTYGTGTFTVAVNAAGVGSAVSGQITLGNACGAQSVPAITLTIDTNPVKTATSAANGTYSFASIPDGSYTITPSIAGASSIFYPATIPITVNGGAVNNLNFVASLGYKVSGTVNYSGAETGQIYVWLLNKSCNGNPLSTSITSPGDFTIEGVPPGTYMLGGAIDSLGFGYPNDSDAASHNSQDVTLLDADLSGTTVTLTDSSGTTLTAGPTINVITPNDTGVVINFNPIIRTDQFFGQIELASSYEVQWAQQSPFPSTPSGTRTFAAGGSNGTGVLILNDPNLVPGQTYYFRMRGLNKVGPGPWTDYTKLAIAAPAGKTVSGEVSFSATPTGPLYVGFYNVATGAVFATRILNPVNPQPYSLTVPTDTTYFNFAILDQNDDGMIDPGDVSNTHNDNVVPMAVADNMTGQDVALDTPAAMANVTTQHFKSTNPDNTVNETYSINFRIKQGNKLPVSVRLLNGPHVLHPVDLGKCLDCGNNQFNYYVSTFGDMPAAGDSYGLQVTYSDATTEILTAQVTAVVNAFAANLSPSGTSDTSLTPTFTWTYPANASNYRYQFYLNDDQGNMIWQIPGNGANSNGFTSTVTSIVWGTDPTGSGSTTAVPSLTHGTTYHWQIQVVDSNGNSTQQMTDYKP